MVKEHEQRDKIIEAICAEGCKFVNQLLESQSLQNENQLLQLLNSQNQQWVLSELDSIMNVYGDSGSCSL